MENGRKQWVVKAAGVGALALMMAVPSFAQSRGERDTRRESGQAESSRRDNGSSRTYRDNDRVSVRGSVRSFSRERDGYRVQLDRGRESFWVPQSYFRNRGRGLDLRVGVQIVLGGVYRGGSVYVDDVSWPDRGGYGYSDDSLAGFVERVDYRTGIADIRDDRTGRVVRADLRNNGRRSSLDIRDMRRGDYVELSGTWYGGVFETYNVDAIRDR